MQRVVNQADVFDRICPGRHFAEMGLFWTIACVVHVFDISMPLDKDAQSIKPELKMSGGWLSYVHYLLGRLRSSNES